MGVQPPWMYDHPTKYSFVGPSERGFNPRAATQASWSPSVPKPKQDGPLIQSKEFNRHPDSYFVVPYGNLDAKAMSPRTKAKVKWTRIVQLSLRVCALLGALGMLVCVICIRGTEATTGWIIRVPPALAILHTIYAIYHLSRSSKGRTPASSASYMLFAAVLDAGLIPFYTFTAMVSHTAHINGSEGEGHWTTLFGNDIATSKIVYSTFLLSVTNGGLHLVSLIISIYLGVIFRKIGKLPPDMNPLEDNLTSRHKKNKSSLLEDHRLSQATTAAASSKRESKVDEPLISPVRTVPFMHTRNDSHSNIGDVPQPNFSPRASRTEISQRSPSPSPTHRTSRTYFPNLNQQQQSRPAASPPPTQSLLKRSPTKASSVYSTSTNESRPRSTAPSLPDSNWITHPSPSPSPSPSRELKSLMSKHVYQPLSQTSPFEYTNENEPSPLPRPLEMNPPTPPIEQHKPMYHYQKAGLEGRALAPSTGNSTPPMEQQKPMYQYKRPGFEGRALAPSTGNWGPGIVGIGKARSWGNNGGGSRGSGNCGGGRVVSRSGVEISKGGILPNGGVRAREVSGKVMAEGRGSGGSWR